MTIHQTDTGFIELIDRYGHGKPAKNNAANAPAHLTVEYDGWTTVWKYTGERRDAAITAAAFDLPDNGTVIGVLDGNRVTFENTPDDFWIDADTRQPATDDTVSIDPDLEKYPRAVAW